MIGETVTPTTNLLHLLPPFNHTIKRPLLSLKNPKSIIPPYTPQPIECFMFSLESSSYKEKFPSIENFEYPQQKVKQHWKIKNPSTKNPDGTRKSVSLAEATLNWQAKNVVSQNHTL